MTTLTCRRPARTAPATGSVRWLVSNAADLVRDGVAAPLTITSITKGGEVTGFYFLTRSPIDGSWLLSREGNDAEGSDEVRYEISRDGWTCSCPAHQHGQNRCKHIAGVMAALKAIGVE